MDDINTQSGGRKNRDYFCNRFIPILRFREENKQANCRKQDGGRGVIKGSGTEVRFRKKMQGNPFACDFACPGDKHRSKKSNCSSTPLH